MMPDDATLMAYADGELDPVERAAVEAAIATDPELAERVAAHRALRNQVNAHFAPVMEEDVPDRFRALLAAAEPAVDTAGAEDARVVDLASFRDQQRRAAPVAARRLPAWANLTALAATLVLGIAVGRFVVGTNGGPIQLRDGGVQAGGELAMALDKGLASQPSTDVAATRIGLTYKDRDGRFCRSFDSAALSGIACREAGAWRVEQAVGGQRHDNAYRQASSGDSRIMAGVTDMIAGAPLDAQQERAARDNGWR